MFASKRSMLGLTLLEVLVAMSIFTIIGVASYRVLVSVIMAQQAAEKHSLELNRLQKAVNLMDQDFQQLVTREIRTGSDARAASLEVGSTSAYAIEFTRGGRRNPLKLSRSSLQRVAYDIGPHPERGVESSLYFQDDQTYLRRHYWTTLDRFPDSKPIIQALLPGVRSLKFVVVDADYIQHDKWPPTTKTTTGNTQSAVLPAPIALQLIVDHKDRGEISKMYKVY